MTANGLPVLWQLELSHYNEKVRWALDFKRIPHVRRALLPGVHLLVARRLTGGECETTPVLTLDGRSIGDSTAIIAALEERWPQPPLYPEDPAERRRALELEDYFDEELGPHLRRAVYHELLDPARARGAADGARSVPLRGGSVPAAVPAGGGAGSASASRSPKRPRSTAVNEPSPSWSGSKRELGPSGYLVGDRFTVADLTAASLLYPVVRRPSSRTRR